jgi:hypothetical protein
MENIASSEKNGFASGGSDVVQKISETRQSHFSKVTDGEAASV